MDKMDTAARGRAARLQRTRMVIQTCEHCCTKSRLSEDVESRHAQHEL
jgi:hypothetical protein